MAVTRAAAIASFGSTAASPTAAYSASFSTLTTVVIGYVNNTLSTANVTAASDNAGNVYTVGGTYPGAAATNGSVTLLYCVLSYPVTTSNTITFTTSGTQKAVYSGSAFTGVRYVGTSTSGTQAATTGVAVGSSWTIPITPSDPSGLAVGAFGFYKDYGFGTAPSAGGAGSTFASWYDGTVTYACSLGMTYEVSSSTAANSVGLVSTTSGATYVGVSIYLSQKNVLPAQRVVSMF